MTRRFVIAGTDTGVGKTVFSAALTLALEGIYFKPVQSGLDGETDEQTARRLTRLPDRHFLPSIYRLRTPASPHLSARIDGLEIDTARLVLPESVDPLIVETAGGVMVPLTDRRLYIDAIQGWGAPVVLCARTTLGTINHSLLTLEALKRRAIPLRGIAFIGEANPEVERSICSIGGAQRLGCLPLLSPLGRETLAEAFARHFRREDFLA